MLLGFLQGVMYNKMRSRAVGFLSAFSFSVPLLLSTPPFNFFALRATEEPRGKGLWLLWEDTRSVANNPAEPSGRDFTNWKYDGGQKAPVDVTIASASDKVRVAVIERFIMFMLLFKCGASVGGLGVCVAQGLNYFKDPPPRVFVYGDCTRNHTVK